MRILDDIASVLIIVGCALSLPVYWWLFVMPVVPLLKRRTRKQRARRIT